MPPYWNTSSIFETFVKFNLKGGLWRITPLPLVNNLIDFPFFYLNLHQNLSPLEDALWQLNIYMVYSDLIYLQHLKCQRWKDAEALSEQSIHPLLVNHFYPDLKIWNQHYLKMKIYFYLSLKLPLKHRKQYIDLHRQ